MTDWTRTIWWWLMAPPATIKKAGEDPDERVVHCGHHRPLSVQWAKSVGCWRHETPKTIMRRTGAARTAYDNFTHRHRVLAASTPATRDLIESLCESAYMAVEHTMTKGLSCGEAARNVLYDSDGRRPVVNLAAHKDVRVLPVELVLYHHAMEQVLEAAKMDLSSYLETDADTRERLWGHVDVIALTRIPSALLLDGL